MGEGMLRDDEQFDVRWFAWRAVREALAHGRAGGIALHRFHHDLRRFGLGLAEPACHMLSADREALVTFGSRFGLRPAWIEPPQPRRPDIWHFDLFGAVLRELEVAYPPPGDLPRRSAPAICDDGAAECLLRDSERCCHE